MSNGVRLKQKPEMIAAGERLRPLRDQIIVKPIDWQPSKVIVLAGGKREPLQGIVVAVGPGHYPRQYNKDRSKSWLSKAFQPCEVKVGDRVQLGGLEIDGYLFPTVLIGNELHVICREADVCGVEEA